MAEIIIVVVAAVLMGTAAWRAHHPKTIDLRERLAPYDQARYVAARRREKSLSR